MEKYYLLEKQSGEIIARISDNEKFIIRSKKQQEHDKLWSENVVFDNKERFMKIFLDKNEKVMLALKETPTTYIILQSLYKYIEKDTNALIKNGKKLKVKDIAEEFGISLPRMSEHIKKLKLINIIAEMEEYKIGKCMHLNPYLVVNSKTINKRTIDLFDKVK